MTSDSEPHHRENQPSNTPPKPSWRKPVGMVIILTFILLWCGVVVTMLDLLEGWSFWIQLPIYIVAGIIWIFPIKPLLRWMNKPIDKT